MTTDHVGSAVDDGWQFPNLSISSGQGSMNSEEKNLSGLKGVFLSSSREYIKLYIYLIVLRSKVSCRCLYIYFTNLCRIKFSMKNTRRLEAIFHTATTRDSQILFQTKDKSVHVHCSRRPFEGKLQFKSTCTILSKNLPFPDLT